MWEDRYCPRNSFYNYIFRRADHSKREEAQIELMRLVQQVFDDSSQRFGAEKIRVTLAGSGVRVSTKRPLRVIMQELGSAVAICPRKAIQEAATICGKTTNLPVDWVGPHRTRSGVVDSQRAGFKVSRHWMYFCIILDLFSRRIVDYRVSRNASTNLVTSTFRTAFRERGNPSGLTFHSDRGKQYTSASFTALLQKCEVKQSFSATARPHDNAVAETFFAYSKEEAYRREYLRTELPKRVEQYIRFTNATCPHRTLKIRHHRRLKPTGTF